MRLTVTRRNQTGPESGSKLDLIFCSHRNGTVRLQTGPISGLFFRTVYFLDILWTGSLDFLRTRVNAAPFHTAFWNGPEQTGTQLPYQRGLILLCRSPYQVLDCESVKLIVAQKGLTIPDGAHYRLMLNCVFF